MKKYIGCDLGGTNLRAAIVDVETGRVLVQKSIATQARKGHEAVMKRMADLFLQLKPGTNIALLNGLMHVILEEGLADRTFMVDRTEGFEALEAVLRKYTPEVVEDITDRKRVEDEIQQLAYYDTLTGLFNRRYMEETLERELSRSQRLRNTLGVVMLDLDHFKEYNDTFGHNAGDELLVALGQLIQELEDVLALLGPRQG